MKLRLLFITLSLFVTFDLAAQVKPFDGAAPIASFDLNDTQTIDLMLRAIHTLPSKAEFEAVSRGRDIVVAFALGPDSLQRDRALIAVAKYWPSGDVFLLLSNVIADPATRQGTRLRAIVSLGETFRDRALPLLDYYLGSDDVSVQIAAIRAIGRGNSVEGFERLAALRKVTSSDIIRDAIDRYGRRIAD